MSTTAHTTTFHQPAARRPISFAAQPRFSLYPLTNEELINNRLSLPPPSLNPAPRLRRRHRASTNEYSKVTVPNHKKLEEDPNEMARLITLVLQPRILDKKEPAYLSLLDALKSEAPKSTTPPPPTIPAKDRRRSIIDVPITPSYTKRELKQAMKEVQSLFGQKHFQKSASTCKHVLEQVQHQPVYTIWLCFFAAISLEQSARSLHNSADSKLPLFRDSLAYYRQAKSNVASASLITPRREARPSRRVCSPTKSISSSNRSSLESLFSQFTLSGSEMSAPSDTYTSNRRMHRRNTSSCSSSIMKPGPLRIQKKVSFSETLPTFSAQPAPRPHEENWDLIINCFPMPPSPSTCPSLMESSEESEDEEIETRSQGNTGAIQSFQLHLKSFEGQLDWHINSINEQIIMLEEAVKKQHRASCGSVRWSKDFKAPMDDETKKAELKITIARRRGEKWERKKFDPTRYQELCEKTLAEMDGSSMF